MASIRGIDHVNLRVTEVEQSLRFWRDTLGLTQVDRADVPGAGAWLEVGNQQIHLSIGTPPPPLGQHVALRVHARDALAEELRAGGYEVDEVAGPSGGDVLLFVQDPDGNIVELCEVPDDGS